jgi:DNA-binding response OmpR family regulator
MTQHSALIVDDSLTVRMDLKEAFEAASFQVTLCASAAEAREAIAKAPTEVVVLDVLLPDGDGIELLRQIRNDERAQDTVVLLLSSETEVADRILGLRTGADEYVGKPYDANYVIARTLELLRLKRGEQGGTTADHTVLLIDDSLTFRDAMREALEAAGYQVTTAASGEEGLRFAAASRPGAIVVDGQLPGIDGNAVIRHVRLDAALRGVPCLLLTASDDKGAELDALDAGADAFVRKDEEVSVILARLGAALRSTESRANESTSSLLSPKKILTVDDSATYLQELAANLREEGYDVVPARSGEEALELLAVQPVDCILMDLEMPGLSGQETCMRIKAAPGVRDIPLIILTARDDRTSMLESLGAGADDHICKTHEFGVLKARVRAQLRRKQFEDENRRIREDLLHEQHAAAVERAARELAETRAALVDELERKSRDLERATQAKGRFLATMSHEIRTPLNAIIGMANLLNGTPLNDEQREYAQVIRTGGDHLLAVINDILDFSSLESGKLPLENRPFNVAELVEESMDLVAAHAREKSLELAYELSPEVPDTVMGDANRVRQILVNFLSNAVKFTARGEVVVEVNNGVTDDGRHELHCSVRDTGIGIPQNKFDRLFQSFSQVDASTRREYGGTGLGLAICKRLAELMHGKVWAESEMGSGSTFHFSMLASVPPDRAKKKLRAAAEPMPLSGVRVWIVEDNETHRRILRRQLQEWGMLVRDTATPRDAIEWADRGEACDLAVLDFQMPGMNGLELAAALHQRRGDGIRKVLLTSGMPLPQDDAQAAGLLAQLSKPVKHAALFNALLKVLDRRKPDATVPATPPAPRGELSPLRVLVAEDNPVNIQLLSILLEHLGYQADIATNGIEALDAMRHNAYDVVLMDVQMPVMDGLEATRQILREWAPENRPRILALTAGVTPEEIEACRQAGMDDVLVKPLNIADLEATMAKCGRLPIHRQ